MRIFQSIIKAIYGGLWLKSVLAMPDSPLQSNTILVLVSGGLEEETKGHEVIKSFCGVAAKGAWAAQPCWAVLLKRCWML